MTEAQAREMLDLVRDIDARVTALAVATAELKVIMERVETRMAECLAVAARAAGQTDVEDDARRLH